KVCSLVISLQSLTFPIVLSGFRRVRSAHHRAEVKTGAQAHPTKSLGGRSLSAICSHSVPVRVPKISASRSGASIFSVNPLVAQTLCDRHDGGEEETDEP